MNLRRVVVLTLTHRHNPIMQFVAAGQAPTLEWKKYLGQKTKQAKSSTHDN